MREANSLNGHSDRAKSIHATINNEALALRASLDEIEDEVRGMKEGAKELLKQPINIAHHLTHPSKIIELRPLTSILAGLTAGALVGAFLKKDSIRVPESLKQIQKPSLPLNTISREINETLNTLVSEVFSKLRGSLVQRLRTTEIKPDDFSDKWQPNSML